MLSHLYLVTCYSCTSGIGANGTESLCQSGDLKSSGREYQMGAIENAVVTVGFQIVLLVLVMVPTISFVTEETVLKTVHMSYVRSSFRLEAVELVARI